MNTQTTFENTAIQNGTTKPFRSGSFLAGIKGSATGVLSTPYQSEGSLTNNFMTQEALEQIRKGGIPDLTDFCRQLMTQVMKNGNDISPVQFAGVFDKVTEINKTDLNRFLKNPETNHVLVRNSFLKIVLIHWPAGRWSGVHGHPNGGGIFKVIKGSLKELRYNSADPRELLTSCIYKKGSKAFIDDRLAYHNVGNPYKASAVTLHVYLLK